MTYSRIQDEKSQNRGALGKNKEDGAISGAFRKKPVV